MDIRLNEQGTYRVRGRVIDVSGTPPQNANISITPRNSIVLSGTSSTSSPYNRNDGTFELQDVPSGSYWVIALVPLPIPREAGSGAPPPRPPTAIAAVDVSGADVDGLLINVIPPIMISGRVRIEGQAGLAESERVSVVLTAPQPGFGPISIPLPAHTNADGTFQVTGVHPGDYRVQVVGLPAGPATPALANPQNSLYIKEARFGGVDAMTQTFTISGPVSDQIEVVLARNSGRINGIVTANSARPSAAVQVALVPDNRERRDLYKFTFIDADGKFAFGAIPPGSYKLLAAPDLDPGAFYDPDIIRQFESTSTAIMIGDSANITVELKLNAPATR
jgi:hypothetical protein